MELPRNIVIGNRVIDRIPAICNTLKLTHGLVLSDPVTAKIAGDKVSDILEADMEMAGDVTEDEIEKFHSEIRNRKLGFIVSVGGGRVIDFGKMTALKKKVPFVSVPTSPSHDGIASERVSLKGKDQRHSLKGEPPIAVAADIEIMRKAPAKLIASGAADVISNYTAVHDWKLAARRGEYYADYSASLSLLSAEIVMNSASGISERTEKGIRNLVEALISSGISISLAGSSRPASGAEHMFSHALDLMGSDALHGEQCGVGSIITAYMQGGDWKSIKDTLKLVGAPVTAGGLGISEEMIVKALLGANRIRKRYTILDEKPLDKKKAEEVCRATGVF